MTQSLTASPRPTSLATGAPKLNKRHLALIQFMVHGIDRPFPRWPKIQPHVPLDVNIAADIAGLRRRNARSLFTWPAFVAAYEQEIAAMRKGEHARSVRKMIDLRDAEGGGTAADRKVQLAASQAVIGEGDRRPNGVNVNVFNGGQKIVAGIVIRLPPSAQGGPLEHPARTIEHEEPSA